MKWKFTAILLFISILRAVANPLPVPSVEISELQFRADGSWVLEIAVNPIAENSIGAIWIKTNSGESMIKDFEDDGFNKLLVIENNNLTVPLFINSLQDSVSIGIEWQDYVDWYSEPIIYGYPNSKIRTPKIGQSIAATLYYSYGTPYSITNSPTIGLQNDSTGMMGTIKGTIYDKNGLPLINMNNSFLEFVPNCGIGFYPQPDGSYSTRVYSCDYIDVWRFAYGRVGSSVVDFTPINFSMQPDSIVIRDIYLISDIVTGINEIKNNTESILKIYPQPIKQQLLNYEISIPIKSAETYLLFKNMNGQEIYRFLVTESKGVIILPENIKNGVYIVQLISNKKNYATTKLIAQ